jgi:acyl-CoA thioesterase FadM
MKQVYLQIADHVRFYHNQEVKFVHNAHQEGNGATLSFKSEMKYKRIYSSLYDTDDVRVALEIKEDGGTRTVFSGWIYTIEQFLLVDQLAR